MGTNLSDSTPLSEGGNPLGADPACPATSRLPDATIVVIDSSRERAAKLKESIEFMDAPKVRVATPSDWSHELRERRLAAVFLSSRLSSEQQQEVIRDVGEVDRNVPIVLVKGTQGAH